MMYFNCYLIGRSIPNLSFSSGFCSFIITTKGCTNLLYMLRIVQNNSDLSLVHVPHDFGKLYLLGFEAELWKTTEPKG